jgi:hypothetical protein
VNPAQRVALEGTQMMGGYGYSSECDLNCKNTPL